jgi:hypothetical protein
MKFVTGSGHEILLRICEFRENWSGEIHTLLKRVKKNIFFRFFHMFSPICMKFVTGSGHEILLRVVSFTKIHTENSRVYMFSYT